jgi:hypothetical protein
MIVSNKSEYMRHAISHAIPLVIDSRERYKYRYINFTFVCVSFRTNTSESSHTRL